MSDALARLVLDVQLAVYDAIQAGQQVELNIERGVAHVNDANTGYVSSTTTDGVSMTIIVNGGAKETWK